MARRLAGTVLLLICCASLAAAQLKPGRVRTSEQFSQGLLINKVDPIYPPLARQARISGAVVLKVAINTSGDVESMQLVSGHPMLAPAAIAAVKHWKYKPYLMSGEPVAVETQVTVNFVLSDKPAAENVAGDTPGAAPSQAPAKNTHAPLPQRIRVSGDLAQRFLKSKVTPEYPPTAKTAHVQGVVELKVNIDKEGNVYHVDLISGHPPLAPAAMEAVREWKYKPYTINDNPIEVETTVQVNFSLAE